jgi:transcription elongation factor GreB
MSKAFLRESDSELPPEPTPAVSLLPLGAKNYITPTGAQRLRNELARLVDVDRPPLAANASDPENKRELLYLDQRIRRLRESLESAEIVEPPAEPDHVVRFGATVTVRESDGEVSRYRLVGVNEAEPEHGWISWSSPLAQALSNATQGDRVSFRAPGGPRELKILAVEYEREVWS